MIVINSLNKVKNNDRIYLCSNITIPSAAYEKWYKFSNCAKKNHDYSYISFDYVDKMKNDFDIWFSVDKQLEKYLCIDRIDSILVSLLYFALITEEDIYTDLIASEKLIFQLNNILIPILCKYSNIKIITITANTSSDLFYENRLVGTGMSCGVDSFHTLLKYSGDEIYDDYRLNTLVYLNVGADRWRLTSSLTEKELDDALVSLEKMRKNRINIATEIANNYNCNLITVESNISDLYQGMFEESHIYRSCSAILALQRGFNKYYFSSTGLKLDDFLPSIETDPGHYEILLLSCLSTENIEFISGGKDCNRIEKMNDISSMDVAMKYLKICDQDEPCYHCTKDYRTIVIIDLLDKYEEFSNIYNVKMVKKVKWKAYYWLLKNKNANPVADMLYPEAKKKRTIPFKSYLFYYVLKPYLFIKGVINEG